MIRSIACICAALWSATASAAPPGYFDLQSGITLESGDSWIDNGKHYKLFGVQSCLRGTTYTDDKGGKQDCGEASLAILAAYIKDTNPVCAPTAQSADITYVVCYASIAKNALDLGTILITQGFAFAALSDSGMPYHPPYAVAEQQARDTKAGLWRFKDVSHPSIILSRLAAEKGASK